MSAIRIGWRPAVPGRLLPIGPTSSDPMLPLSFEESCRSTFKFTGLRGFLRRSGGMMGWATGGYPLDGFTHHRTTLLLHYAPTHPDLQTPLGESSPSRALSRRGTLVQPIHTSLQSASDRIGLVYVAQDSKMPRTHEHRAKPAFRFWENVSKL